MEKQLVYPVIPTVTPIYLSDKDNMIMFPDLENKGAAIGLQLPEGLDVVVNELLHRPPPIENIAQMLTQADSLAAGMVRRAQAMGGLIADKAAALQTGPPAAPTTTHPLWKTGAQYTKIISERVVSVTSWATDMVGQATEKVGELIKPVMPTLNQEQKEEKKVDEHVEKSSGSKPIQSENSPVKQVATDITIVGKEALDKLLEALRKSAQILATSIRDNTVQVVQHRFGKDMMEAMGDMMESVKNTLIVAQHINGLKVENIAQKAITKIVVGTYGKQNHYVCNS